MSSVTAVAAAACVDGGDPAPVEDPGNFLGEGGPVSGVTVYDVKDDWMIRYRPS